MENFIWIAFLASAIMPTRADFNMWPAVDSTRLASAMGFSVNCLEAMNKTVACDPDLFRMTGQLDRYYWDKDNITDLCTTDCTQSASDWYSGVIDVCDGQTITIDRKLVPVDSVADRYSDGIGLACLTDVQLPVLLSFNQTPEVDPTPTSNEPPFPITTAPSTTSPTNGDGVPFMDRNSTFNYCFLEAQNWVGVDIIPPDCGANPTNILCTDPDAGNRIANLYNDTILCSNCFLSVMWWRINSPYLPDTDESDDLISQFQDIADVCNITMPPSLIRAPPNYPAAPTPTYLPPGTDPNENATTSNGGVCAGQTIAAGSTKRDGRQLVDRGAQLLELEGDHSAYARVKRASAGTCDSLSQTYGITTGDLQTITGSENCSFSTSPICVPLKCSVTQVTSGQTCASIASSLSTSTVNVTVPLFLQWNPNIIGLCDSLATDQYICNGPPGGGYTLPPPINGTDTDANGQVRGGQGSTSNPDGPNGPNGPSANSTTSAPTQAGIVDTCNAFAYARADDTCYQMSQRFHITLTQLTTWNPNLGYPDGHNCTTQFWAGYDYCVGVSGSSTTTKLPPTSTTSSGPSLPTQSGIIVSCNKYKGAVAGDYCSKFAQDNGLSTDQLYAWNMILGNGGSACNTQFQAGYDYCIGISTTTTSSTSATAKSAPPIPTQSGLVPNCAKIVVAQKGDYCYAFAQNNGITTAQLYTWNPVLGPNGENCNTQFQAGEGYCVAVKS